MAKILVTDDDPNILVIVEKLLLHAGHQVLVASDAYKAMETLHEYEIDLLLSDANMPHYSGFELIKTIRSEKNFVNLRVIMMTGRREKKDIDLALSIGVTDYIVKPIDAQVFLKKIGQHFKRHPATVRTIVDWPSSDAPLPGTLQNSIQITAVYKDGLSFISNTPIKTGIQIEIDCTLFASFGMPAPDYQVTQCQKTKNDEWEINVLFKDATEAFLKLLRTELLHSSKQLKSA